MHVLGSTTGDGGHVAGWSRKLCRPEGVDPRLQTTDGLPPDERLSPMHPEPAASTVGRAQGQLVRRMLQPHPSGLEHGLFRHPGDDEGPQPLRSALWERPAFPSIQGVFVESWEEPAGNALDVDAERALRPGRAGQDDVCGARAPQAGPRQLRRPVRSSARRTSTRHLEQRGARRRLAAMLHRRQAQCCPGGQSPTAVAVTTPRRRMRLVGRRGRRGGVDQAPSGEHRQLLVQPLDRDLDEGDQRRLMRRYCTTAIGAKTAMIAAQQSTE